MTDKVVNRMLNAAAARYRSAGRIAWLFARGKLSGDPVFVGLLKHGLIPQRARILDIGCGQGLLASWLCAAQAMQQDGQWPAQWPPAPNPLSMHGIELVARNVERARRALGDAAGFTFTTGDMCRLDFGQADAVVILDVLHYVSVAAQDDVLRRVRDALAPNGTLLLRVGDAGGGLPFRIGVWVDHVVTFIHGHRNRRLHCRSLADWCAALIGLGFNVSTLSMNQGTPFANMLIVAKPSVAPMVKSAPSPTTVIIHAQEFN